MDRPLEGKTAIVTGASSGIGLATARAMARAGAAVVVSARRKDRLDALVDEIIAQGGKAISVRGDAGLIGDIDYLLERTLAWDEGGNKYDIVVVNAGRGLAGGVLASDEAQWQELYQVNVLGAGHLMRRAGEYLMKRKSGDIVVIGSVVGRYVSPFSGFYGSSKFAVGAMAEALRREVSSHGVRVCLIMPGIVKSEFQEVAGYTEENFGKTVAQFGTLLEPRNIADTIQWLLSQPSHMNISELIIRPTGQSAP
ncbi:MAG TPA: SDR family oxidoreductase [Geobacteraceae bacterium]